MTCFFQLSQNGPTRRDTADRYNGVVWSSRESRRTRARWGRSVRSRPSNSCGDVVALVAEGQTPEQILVLYPDLEAEDIREALFFAAEAVRERALPLAAGE